MEPKSSVKKQMPPNEVTACDALDALEEKNFVIVITDLIMPEMSGIELLHEIKARSKKSQPAGSKSNRRNPSMT